MTGQERSEDFFIGWDVGGWNCDHNPNSRDAIVILDEQLALVGKPWRGNLRARINASANSREFIRNLFSLCAVDLLLNPAYVILAIDTPLGFSDGFVNLLSNHRYVEPIEESSANPYLYRQTERYLYTQGLKPLSPLKDMIGSQATKGIHALAKFAPQVLHCGVWSDGERLSVIETYPSACKRSALVNRLRKRVANQTSLHQDENDALTCALIAYLFKSNPDMLISPLESVPTGEGWIWVPVDILEVRS